MKKIITLLLCFSIIVGVFSFAEETKTDNASDKEATQHNEKNSTDNNTQEKENTSFENTAEASILTAEEDKKFSNNIDNEAIHKMVLKYIHRYKLNGVSLVIAKDNKIIYSYNHGFLDAEKMNPVNNESLLRTASVTKFITALGLLKLYDEGKINLDEDISNYLGIKIANPKHPEVPITARQLLSHTSSIANGGLFSTNSKSLTNIIGLNEECKNNFSNNVPGTKYAYKNLNGGLLGSLIEAVSKESLQSYMEREFFNPLGMRAYYNLSLVKDLDLNNVSSIFMRDFSLLRRPNTILKAAKESYNNSPNPLYNYNISIGSLWTNANYLIKPLMMLANKGELNGKRYLREETINMMIADQSKINGSSVKLENGKYGLSVERMLSLGKYPWYGHQGRFEGTLACAYFQPETKLCIALVCNRWDNKMLNGIALFSTRLVQGLEKLVETNVIQ